MDGVVLMITVTTAGNIHLNSIPYQFTTRQTREIKNHNLQSYTDNTQNAHAEHYLSNSTFSATQSDNCLQHVKRNCEMGADFSGVFHTLQVNGIVVGGSV